MASPINTTSSKWLDAFQDTPVHNLISTLKIPIYHIATQVHIDMGHDSKGRRRRYVDSIDAYIWSSKDSKPIVYKYSIDPRGKSNYLEATYTEYLHINDLHVISDDEGYDYDGQDEPVSLTAHQLYNQICKAIGVQGVPDCPSCHTDRSITIHPSKYHTHSK